jgi:hypothetical protein
MLLIKIYELYRFFEEALTYARPDEADLEDTGAEAPYQLRVHRRIVLVSALFGLLAAGGGSLYLIQEGNAAQHLDSKLLLAPFLFAAGGLLLGVALACLFAPRRFLESPVGRKWMGLIGTESIFVARLVCLILTLVLGSLPAAAVMLLLFDRP